ncbi:hypothetical protein WT72_17910 [Burkholderia pseudomultivorans]|uniref:hypothetical protein n=1 Tax=Burkholderia pseudomultivorans TaxID=1207504 RepID=UPI00076D8118|nr:hypothetical protein [Burkholderia pseudomultivorans]KWI54707.1 hypothetical protein WT72_17910 [Burkholderia pseudomultivorans]
MGHHLIPRGKANSIDLDALGAERNTPTFFPEPYEAGIHEELHRAIKGDIGKLQEELFEASSKGLDSVSHIKGDLRIPATGEVLATNVTPKEAHGKLVEWYKSKGSGGVNAA